MGDFRRGAFQEFGSTRHVVDVHAILANHRKKPTETYSEYIYGIRRIGAEVDFSEQTLIKYIIGGLSDPDLFRALVTQNINLISVLALGIMKDL